MGTNNERKTTLKKKNFLLKYRRVPTLLEGVAPEISTTF